MDWLPSRARETIFGGVNSVARTLVFVIPNIELNRKSAAEIHPVDIVVSPDCAHHLRLERTIFTVRKADAGWKFAQRPTRRSGNLRPEAMRREDSSHKNHRGHGDSQKSHRQISTGFCCLKC